MVKECKLNHVRTVGWLGKKRFKVISYLRKVLARVTESHSGLEGNLENPYFPYYKTGLSTKMHLPKTMWDQTQFL